MESTLQSTSLLSSFSNGSDATSAALSTGSVTKLIHGLRDGDESAANNLWDLYFARIVGLAKKQLWHTYRADFDEEDVALSALKSVFFCVGKKQSIADIDRDAFWKIIATITIRKVCDAIAFRRRQKRNPLKSPGAERVTLDSDEAANLLLSTELSPAVAVEIEEQFDQMLGTLPKDEFRKIVALKLEGYTNQEIASKLNRGLSSIERKLKNIRQIWRDKFHV